MRQLALRISVRRRFCFRKTGKPVYPAIVWQCRRTADKIDALKKDGFDKVIRERTGLIPDAYFSATKICWILEHVEGARRWQRTESFCSALWTPG